MTHKTRLGFVVIVFLLLAAPRGFSLCKPRFVNPVTEVCWNLYLSHKDRRYNRTFDRRTGR